MHPCPPNWVAFVYYAQASQTFSAWIKYRHWTYKVIKHTCTMQFYTRTSSLTLSTPTTSAVIVCNRFLPPSSSFHQIKKPKHLEISYCWLLICPIQTDAKAGKMAETLANWYSSESIQWIPTWQGLNGFQESSHPRALDKSTLSIGRVNLGEISLRIGTHLRVLNEESYPMNTNMTGFEWFPGIFATVCFGRR